MSSLLALLVVTAVSSSRCHADTNVSDYVQWQKTDIALWDRYFPRRALRQELLMNTAAQAAVSSLSSGLTSSLGSVVAFQRQELHIAEELMAGTEAEGCVAGISNFVNQSVEREVATYSDCSADALANLIRLNKTLDNTKSKYDAAFQRVQSGIDFCARIYTDKGSIDRLRACVAAMTKNYFTASNDTLAAVTPSPSMGYFTETVVGCASTAAVNVAADGSQFLKLLLYCATLSGTVNITAYADELNQWEGYNDTLYSQISNAQRENYNQMLAVESEIQSYFDLQKQVLEKYVIESRSLNYYLNKTTWYLIDYFTSVNQTLIDNPGIIACALTAKNELDNIVKIGGNTSLSCDMEIVNNTKQLISTITKNFMLLNQLMPSAGDVAILNCFAQGYVFAPNTIYDCFQLAYTEFEVDHDDLYAAITLDVTILSSYVDTFFNSSWLPCGSNLRRERLAADTALYRLQRCLYEDTGTVYDVTTPKTTPYIPYKTTDTNPTSKYVTISTYPATTQYPTTNQPVTTTLQPLTTFFENISSYQSTTSQTTTDVPPTTTTTDIPPTTTTTDIPPTTTTTDIPPTTTDEPLTIPTSDVPSTTTTTDIPPTTTTTDIPPTTTTTDIPPTTTDEPLTIPTSDVPSTTTTTYAPPKTTTTVPPKTARTRHTRRHKATTPHSHHITPTMGPFTSFLHKIFQFLSHFIIL